LQPNEEDKVNEHTGSTQSKTADAGDDSSDGSISDSDAENDKGACVIYFMFYYIVIKIITSKNPMNDCIQLP